MHYESQPRRCLRSVTKKLTTSKGLEVPLYTCLELNDLIDFIEERFVDYIAGFLHILQEQGLDASEPRSSLASQILTAVVRPFSNVAGDCNSPLQGPKLSWRTMTKMSSYHQCCKEYLQVM